MPPDYDLCLLALDEFTIHEYGMSLEYRVHVKRPGEFVIASDGTPVLATLEKTHHNLFEGPVWTVVTMYDSACELTAHEVITHLKVIELEGDSWGNRNHKRKDLEADQGRFIKHFRESQG